MTHRRFRPLLIAAPLAVLAASVASAPASALTDCSQAAHAFATYQISLITPLKKLESCLKEALANSKAKADLDAAEKNPVNWSSCRATAARYAKDASSVPVRDLAELHHCVKASIKDFN
jgi:hypothetical protein